SDNLVFDNLVFEGEKRARVDRELGWHPRIFCRRMVKCITGSDDKPGYPFSLVSSKMNWG
ncbi:hypothetical protein, partial [Actinobacillus pleuropneumoniae]|uniref:hypothetical protein n=1 Tax=Actinobacillus pleuropneumoniae TaxID=715 RepID=UPI00227A5274